MIQPGIYTALHGLVEGRCYAGVAPDNPVTPYIVFSRVASVPENTLSSGQPVQQTRIQVDMYDKSYDAAQSLADSVQVAILTLAYPIQATQTLEQDMYESEVKLHRVSHDYSIYHR